MREILFRGKRLDNGEWVYGNLRVEHFLGTEEIHEWWRCSIYVPEDGRPWHCSIYDVDTETVGQYIGTKDINENPIFEGDIVEVPGEDGYFLLKWDSDAARFSIEGNGLYLDFDNCWAYEIEVIDNIHDNPELLGGAT